MGAAQSTGHNSYYAQSSQSSDSNRDRRRTTPRSRRQHPHPGYTRDRNSQRSNDPGSHSTSYYTTLYTPSTPGPSTSSHSYSYSQSNTENAPTGSGPRSDYSGYTSSTRSTWQEYEESLGDEYEGYDDEDDDDGDTVREDDWETSTICSSVTTGSSSTVTDCPWCSPRSSRGGSSSYSSTPTTQTWDSSTDTGYPFDFGSDDATITGRSESESRVNERRTRFVTPPRRPTSDALHLWLGPDELERYEVSYYHQSPPTSRPRVDTSRSSSDRSDSGTYIQQDAASVRQNLEIIKSQWREDLEEARRLASIRREERKETVLECFGLWVVGDDEGRRSDQVERSPWVLEEEELRRAEEEEEEEENREYWREAEERAEAARVELEAEQRRIAKEEAEAERWRLEIEQAAELRKIEEARQKAEREREKRKAAKERKKMREAERRREEEEERRREEERKLEEEIMRRKIEEEAARVEEELRSQAEERAAVLRRLEEAKAEQRRLNEESEQRWAKEQESNESSKVLRRIRERLGSMKGPELGSPGSKYRQLAREEGGEADKCAERASQAKSQKEKDRWLKQSQQHKTTMADLYSLAENDIFQHHNPSYDPSDSASLRRCDLHGLFVREALDRTKSHIEACKENRVKSTQVITGRGAHSKGGIARIRPAVTKMVRDMGLKLLSNPGDGWVTIAF